MARYDFECEECGRTFEVQEPMSKHDVDASPECPECGSRETRQVLGAFYPETSDKT